MQLYNQQYKKGWVLVVCDCGSIFAVQDYVGHGECPQCRAYADLNELENG